MSAMQAGLKANMPIDWATHQLAYPTYLHYT